MDNTQKSPTVLSLCTGYGGVELGLERIFGEITVIANVEIEAFAVANLVNKMETGRLAPSPIWTDIKTFDARPFQGCVDILTGGYPCQPFSAAGKRAGKSDPRHLWPYIRTIIMDCRPGQVFLENVEGHLSLGISEVLSDLEEMGYEVKAGIFSAVEVGAPHQRKRVFILADSDQSRFKTLWDKQVKERGENVAGESGELAHNAHGVTRERSILRQDRKGSEVSIRRSCELAHPESKRYEKRMQPEATSNGGRWPSRPGEEQYEWEEPRVVANPTGGDRGGKLRNVFEEDASKPGPEKQHENKAGEYIPAGRRQTEPGLGRAVNGTSSRVDRLRLLGNGVVPQTAEKAYRVLSSEL